MPVWSWFFITAAVLIAFTLALVAILSVTGRKRTERLKKHFGPEYERAVARPVISEPVNRSSLRANESERNSNRPIVTRSAHKVCRTLADGAGCVRR